MKIRFCPFTTLILILSALAIMQHASAQQRDPAAEIVNVRGKAEVFRANTGTWEPAVPRQVLFAGDAIRTGVLGQVTVIMADESLVQIHRSSRFALKAVAQQAGWMRLRGLIKTAKEKLDSIYSLTRGQIWLRNKNRSVSARIETQYVTAAIRGTEFNIRVDPEEGTSITILEGVVLASNALGSLEGVSGEVIITAPGAAPRKRVLINPEDAVQWTLSLPSFFSFSEFPLVSADRQALGSELQRLQSGPGGTALRQARILRDLGRTDDAIALFNQLLATDPGDEGANVGLGWCLLDRGQPETALRHFGSYESADAYTGRVAAHATLSNYVEANNALSAGLAKHPVNTLLSEQVAMLAMLTGDFLDASRQLQTITEKTPDSAAAWRALALDWVILGRTVEATKAASKAVELAPNSPRSHIIMSYAQQAAFALDAAEQSLRQALALEDTNITALLNLTRLQFGDDRLAQAQQTIERVSSLAPGDPEAENLHGFILLAARKADAAIARFDAALITDPGLAEAYMGRGLAYMRKGDVATAMESITTAVALEPQRSLFMSYWGKILYQIRRFDKALDVLARAEQLDPRDPTPIFYRAIILRDLNRPAEAIRVMNRAIALNDNRAVYRSRFLLDQDLAVRNVDLSILYQQLGLNAWSQAKALDAIKADYLNYAGHLAFAGSLEQREDRSFPFFNEQLLARLLQPANVNTFNSFNQYTSFLEQPSFDGIATARLGNLDRKDAQLIGYGNLPNFNLAYQFGAFYSQTDNWRDTNFDRFTDLAGILKWQPTPKDGLMVAFSVLDTKRGDEQFRRFEFSSPSDPVERQAVDQNRLEIGYHHHFSKDTDLIAYIAYLGQDIVLVDHGADTVFPTPTAIADFDFRADVKQRQPLYQAQLQLMHKLGDHQLIAGTLHTVKAVDVLVRSKTAVELRVPSFNFSARAELVDALKNEEDIRFESYYLHDVWRVNERLTLEAAVYYDHFENAAPTAGTKWNQHQINPRLGVIWQIDPRNKLRLAAFRYLLPFVPARTDPSDVAGIAIARNVEEGSRITEYDIVWEREWASGFLSANLFRLTKTVRDNVIQGGQEQGRVRKGDSNGLELELNQLIADRFALSAQYRFLDVEDDTFPFTVAELPLFEHPLPETDRQEQLLVLGLRYVFPIGLSGGIKQTFRNLDLRDGRSNENIHITDLDLNYELPNKRGNLSIEARNVFDEEFEWVTDRFILNGRIPSREIIGTISINF